MLVKEKIIQKTDVKDLAVFLTLSGVAVLLPFFLHIQWLTGPVVNAILILALFLVGIRGALVLCLIPSLMALSGGLLPAVLAPAVPFIMVGNVILVLVVDWFFRRTEKAVVGYILGVIAGASLKFLFLSGSVNLISSLLLKQELVGKIAVMMSWPQLFTALAGGFLAGVILKSLKKI